MSSSRFSTATTRSSARALSPRLLAASLQTRSHVQPPAVTRQILRRVFSRPLSSVAARKALPLRHRGPRVTTSQPGVPVAFAAPAALPNGSANHYTGSSAFSYLPSIEADLDPSTSPAPSRQLPRAVDGPADNPQLANPLERHTRLGTGWMGVIVEYEGVAVDDCSDLHTKAWQQLAQEEGKPQPLHWALKRAEGMKNEQVVQEVLLWSRAPMEVRRLCARKEELFRALRGDCPPATPLGFANLLTMLAKNDVPVALACSAPEARVQPALEAAGLLPQLAAVITAEDVARGRPDPDGILYAAQQLQRPPIRCVLVGNSNASVESAREVGMAVVVVAGRTPVYDLTAADLVVRSLDELSFINLKQLFREEAQVAFQLEEELEGEPGTRQQAQTLLMDR